MLRVWALCFGLVEEENKQDGGRDMGTKKVWILLPCSLTLNPELHSESSFMVPRSTPLPLAPWDRPTKVQAVERCREAQGMQVR